jgi:hypothetical protein
VFLKSKRCWISLRAWSTALPTSGIETWETMSNEKSFAMALILRSRGRARSRPVPVAGDRLAR